MNNDKLYEMMHRHAAALFASDELTFLKAQIGDLADNLQDREPAENIAMCLDDISASITIMETRLDLIRQVLEGFVKVRR